MPPEPTESEVVSNPPAQQSRRPLIDETVTTHLLQIFGNPSQSYTPTQSQVDKILSLQEKGMDYTHHERTHISPRQKVSIGIFVAVILALMTIFTMTLFYAKEYLREVIAGIVGFLAGAGGGYGIGKSSSKNSEG